LGRALPHDDDVRRDIAALNARIDQLFALLGNRNNEADESVGDNEPIVMVRANEQPQGKATTPVAEVPAAVKEQLDKFHDMIRKQQGIDGMVTDIDSMSYFPQLRLPKKLLMPTLSKFDGTGDPRAHLAQYVNTMKLHGVDNEGVVMLFPQSLEGPASGIICWIRQPPLAGTSWPRSLPSSNAITTPLL
jgi:hypothetical protein